MAARGTEREPNRTCVGCRRVRPRSELIRVVARDGVATVDTAKRAAGRGAYLCSDPQCARRARGALAKALRTDGLRVEELIEAV
jgi:hypothetical protein